MNKYRQSLMDKTRNGEIDDPFAYQWALLVAMKPEGTWEHYLSLVSSKWPQLCDFARDDD
jgi:hypothetical protein